MASSKRRRFSAQFKAEAVQLVVQDDRPIVEVARELQINRGALGNWVLKYREQNPDRCRRCRRPTTSGWRSWNTKCVGCGWKMSS